MEEEKRTIRPSLSIQRRSSSSPVPSSLPSDSSPSSSLLDQLEPDSISSMRSLELRKPLRSSSSFSQLVRIRRPPLPLSVNSPLQTGRRGSSGLSTSLPPGRNGAKSRHEDGRRCTRGKGRTKTFVSTRSPSSSNPERWSRVSSSSPSTRTSISIRSAGWNSFRVCSLPSR